jgi:hypothetical protein
VIVQGQSEGEGRALGGAQAPVSGPEQSYFFLDGRGFYTRRTVAVNRQRDLMSKVFWVFIGLRPDKQNFRLSRV